MNHLAWVGTGIAMLLAGTGAALAQAPSGKLELRAQVPVICILDIQPAAKATRLDIRSGETAATVGWVTERCNSPGGYKVEVSASYDAQLVSEDGRTSVPFTTHYDGKSARLLQAMVAQRDQSTAGLSRELAVTVPAQAGAPAGAYTGRLNLIIKAR